MRSSASMRALSRTASCSRRLVVRDGDLQQLAHHGLDVAPDVPHLGELGGLHLVEGRLGEDRQAPRDLGLADAGRPDQDDVLGGDFVAQLRRDLAAAPAVAQRHGHRALGAVLADDVPVQLRDDFKGLEVFHGRRVRAHISSIVITSLV